MHKPIFNMQKKFINTTAGFELYKMSEKGLIKYFIFTGKKLWFHKPLKAFNSKRYLLVGQDGGETPDPVRSQQLSPRWFGLYSS